MSHSGDIAEHSAWIPLNRAAVMLGKTERQVRYMIRTERIDAVKERGRWLVCCKDLPLRAQPDSSNHFLESAIDKADFLETDMGALLGGGDLGKSHPFSEAVGAYPEGVEPGCHARITRSDGSSLDLMIPFHGESTVHQLVCSFLRA